MNDFNSKGADEKQDQPSMRHDAQLPTVNVESPNRDKPGNDQRITLIFIINSKEYAEEVNVNQPLHVSAQKALHTSNNATRDIKQWTLQTEAGDNLDIESKVEDYNLEDGAKLFFTPGAGIGGSVVQIESETEAMSLVDPQIARTKYQEQVTNFRSNEAMQRARGILLLKAEFPYVLFGFAVPRIKPTPILFGVKIDFSDFDLQPLSVQFVDPFTERPLRAEEVGSHFFKRTGTVQTPDANGGIQLDVQPLLQFHAPDGLPFLCVRGIREYHNHPAHTGDSWFLYRNTEVGTLDHIINVLYNYGINPLMGYQFQLGLPPDPNRIPA
ncbi:putative metal-binding protein [Adhaeribacter aquaticus]|uniref:putative metal-binding protein n=1 Tax=Adhaeribacter aquaticus TaxID=299567 RepID=UPI0006872D87|nr:putative metal-binding protein [Adhaeribacter aquaticus]